MRMSRGASARYEKPRSGRSSCGELTPRSNRTPLADPGSTPDLGGDLGQAVEARPAHDGPVAELRQALRSSPPRHRGRGRDRAGADADGRPRSAAACPPPPTVASITTPAGHRGEQRHHLVDHDRLVREHLAHPQPLDWRDAVGRVAPATRLEAGGGGVFHRTSRGAAHVPGARARGLCAVGSDRCSCAFCSCRPFSAAPCCLVRRRR